MKIEGGKQGYVLGEERRDLRTPLKDDPRTAHSCVRVMKDASVGLASRTILVEALARDVSVMLPGSEIGYPVTVKRLDGSANTVTIYPVGSATIDGAASLALTVQYQTVVLLSDGTNWHRIGGYTP